MKKITKQTVFEEHNKSPRRKCFKQSGVQKQKDKPTFSVAIESAKKMFEAQTSKSLNYSEYYHNYWAYITEEEISQIEDWERRQGSLIYLQDCLSLSIAIDSNLIDNTSGQYTHIGLLEHKGKNSADEQAIIEISKIVSKIITSLPFYKVADVICAVPPRAGKDFDLPSSVTSRVSEQTGKQDITQNFVFEDQKQSVKNSAFNEKWDIWEAAKVHFQNNASCDITGKTVILIDDKYQSGITIQYIAMKLQEAGASEVYGLSFVKTLSDTDNV